jgi:predicted nucleotidyltransferase
MTLFKQGLIEHITQTIVEHCNPRRIILFGSYARGDAGPDSDLDIFVEMETPLGYYDRAIAIDALFDMRDWPMDIIVYTPEEVKQWTGQVGTMLSYVEQEGRVLYERDAPSVVSRVAAKSGA